MSNQKRPTTEQLARQIEAYREELPCYVRYADALRRVLERACKLAVPDAIVQARAKDMSSFAEKCVRRFATYPEGAKQMTDLCGGRVIVQTLQQVTAVRLFVEENFDIRECDDKGLLLGEDTFGYRDMHYLVRLRADRAEAVGFTPEEIKTIGQRTAELQVRTWVQHAWADTLHDRMYKAPLKLSAEAKRTGALLAAIMEDGDRAFDRLATEIDGMVANYAALHGRSHVTDEIAVQELILGSEEDEHKRPRIALQLARLLGPCGEHEKVVKVLEPFADSQVPLRCEILLELGHALCRAHRARPRSKEYQLGQKYLTEVVEHCTCGDLAVVPNLRKQKSVHAKALARLAWSWEAVPDGEGQARERYREALEMEPANPYLLAGQLGFEIFCLRSDSMIDSMRSALGQAVETCRQHAVSGTELPYAWFTAGRLSLLLGKVEEAIGWYARGLRHLFDKQSCVPLDVLEDEIQWIRRIHFGVKEPPKEHGWIERLIELARASWTACEADKSKASAKAAKKEKRTKKQKERRVLILAGGAAKMKAQTLKQVRPLVRQALEVFEGMVVSGGTAVGVPGCAGEVAEQLKKQRRKRFELVGYRPESLPDDAPRDDRYDRTEIFKRESDFSAEQILRTWEDLLKSDVRPCQVLVLGLGGGRLTAVEYYVALALGATVGVVQLPQDHPKGHAHLAKGADGCGRGSAVNAQAIVGDALWAGTSSLYPLPPDEASVRAFAATVINEFEQAKLEEMAMAFHERYLEQSTGKLPENLRPWPKLPQTYRKANLEQAAYAVEILRAAGFVVRPAKGKPDTSIKFTPDEIKRMAMLEHGRWNVERLRDGWLPGRPRDNAKKIHDCLVSWAKLPGSIKERDRVGVRGFPEILAKAGMEVVRE